MWRRWSWLSGCDCEVDGKGREGGGRVDKVGDLMCFSPLFVYLCVRARIESKSKTPMIHLQLVMLIIVTTAWIGQDRTGLEP